MKRRVSSILFVLVIMFGLVSSVSAQGDYYFAVDEEIVHVYWNEDGSLSLDYTFLFNNQPGAHVIDFVDVGLPTYSYSFNSITADVDGAAVEISSDYQGSGSGIAVDLGPRAIPPGRSGRVHIFIGRVEDVLYSDSDDDTYASAVFSPTWFGSQYVTGSTDLTVVFHLPPGIQPEEPRWHAAPSGFPSEPETGLDSNGRVTYTWRNPEASASRQYEFGASFPKTYVPESAIQTEPVFTPSPINFDDLIGFGCCGLFAFLFFGMPILGVINSRRRKMQYLPPKISIEGHGIKRGLTAVEAAILMEQPLDKVLTMILFGVVKKGAAEVETRDPLKLKITKPLPDGLHEYEKNFLAAFRPDANLKQRRKDLQEMTIKLVKSISEKMKGFSRKETIAYYKSIMERAWQQIAAAGTPEVQSQLFEDAMEWTMLDEDYDDRTRRTFTGPVFVPTWWGRYDPSIGRSTGGSQPVSVGGKQSAPSVRPTGLPGADFAASMVTGVQNFSQKVIGNVSEFTGNVTNKTNPPPKPSSGSSSGGRSSGGCACACACAGCACACAGGGR